MLTLNCCVLLAQLTTDPPGQEVFLAGNDIPFIRAQEIFDKDAYKVRDLEQVLPRRTPRWSLS